jgi:LysM repeat protein
MKHNVLYFFSVVIIILAVCLLPSAASAQTTNIKYVVQRGDTLGTIAQKYCTTWHHL